MGRQPQSQPAEQSRLLGRPVYPAGSGKSGILFIGEAPGAAEEAKGQPFVGKTGKEMSRLCRQAGIHYPDTRRCNVVLYRPYTRSETGNTTPTAWEIKRDEHILIEEIRKSQPQWIAAVGRTAAVWLLGTVDVEDCHGFSFPIYFCLKCGKRRQCERQATTNPTSDEEDQKDQNVLVVDGGSAEQSSLSVGTVRRGVVEREERTSPSRSVRSVDRKSDPTGTGDRSQMRATTVREPKAHEGLPAERQRTTGRRADSKERTEESVQARSSIQPKEHLRTQGQETREILYPVQSAESKCKACTARTIRINVVVTYHPAAGLHQPEVQPLVHWDFMRLGQYVAGRLDPNPPVDEYPDPDYYEPRGAVEISQSGVLALDTEGLRGRVWGLSYCQTPGSAGVVRVTNKKALRSVKEQLYGR